MLTIYGIKNCDTMKKAFTWLDEHKLKYHFHDYRKDGIDATLLSNWVGRVGWQIVINKRSTTWRTLPGEDKSDIDDEKAVALMLQNPTLIKRPVLIDSKTNEMLVGFSEKNYSSTIKTGE